MFEDDNKNAGPITLTDEICETSTVLEVFLDLLHGGSLPLLIEGTNTHIQAVIALARKYDCPGMLYTLNSVLRGAVLEARFDKVDLFIALSHFEDVSGCAEAIRRHRHNHIEKTARRGSSTLTQPLPDLAWANPASWNYERASRANFRFLFALFRAVYTVTPLLYTATPYYNNREVTPIQYTDSQREQVAAEFTRLLRSTCMSSACDHRVCLTPHCCLRQCAFANSSA
jgi:hypothetical protein